MVSNTRQRAIKLKRWVCLWLWITGERSLAVFKDQTAFLQLLAYLVLLYLIFVARGLDAVGTEIDHAWFAIQAVIYALPLFLLVNLITSLFLVSGQQARKGEWVSSRFVYHHPLLVKTKLATPEDDGKSEYVRLTDAEPKAFATFKIEYERGHAVAIIESPHARIQNNLLSKIDRQVQYGAKLDRCKRAVLTIKSPPSSDPTVIRISVLYWEIQ